MPFEFPELSESLNKEILNLPKKCSRETVKDIIKNLCSLYPLKPNELGRIIDRDPQYLRINFLSKMVKDGELIHLYPDNPAHPKQAYLVPKEEGE